MCWMWLSYITNTLETVTLEILKWTFEDRWVHISFFHVPYIYFVSLHVIVIEPSVCLTVVFYNIKFFGALLHNFDFVFFIITFGPGLKILCMTFVRTVGGVHIVMIPSVTGFQTGNNLTVYKATVLFQMILRAQCIFKIFFAVFFSAKLQVLFIM
jgi:hypothetical protein